MPTYDYRCRVCGPFTLARPMHEDTAHGACPDCRSDATRVYTVPMLIDRTSPVRRALSSAEASAAEPAVVRRTGGEPGAAARLPGKLAGLPRP